MIDVHQLQKLIKASIQIFEYAKDECLINSVARCQRL